MSVVKRDYLADFRLQTLLIFLILNGAAKTKLTILEFLYWGEIVKNSILRAVEPKIDLQFVGFEIQATGRQGETWTLGRFLCNISVVLSKLFLAWFSIFLA